MFHAWLDSFTLLKLGALEVYAPGVLLVSTYHNGGGMRRDTRYICHFVIEIFMVVEIFNSMTPGQILMLAFFVYKLTSSR